MAIEVGVAAWDFKYQGSAKVGKKQNSLLMASASALKVFDIMTGLTDPIVALKADNPKIRYNDRRAYARGGFRIGTMANYHKKHTDAIYQYFRSKLRQLVPNISNSNDICFAPNGSFSYLLNSFERWQLSETDGWPVDDPELFIDLQSEDLNMDEAVVNSVDDIWSTHRA